MEPFLGSGVVGLNIAPPRALLTDANPHIVRLYQDIQSRRLTGDSAREALSAEGARLSKEGERVYYEIRERFNATPSSIDFLFLNRSCFNGVVRFNRKGGFNTPFGHKPQRYDASFLTRVANQIRWARKQMDGKDWTFATMDWRNALSDVDANDFVYIDPPYVGRHADYYSQWSETQATDLAAAVQALPSGFALSMWLENRFRKNDHIEAAWADNDIRLASHFYHVGSTESLRNEMTEALVIRPGFATPDEGVYQTKRAPGVRAEALTLDLL